MALGSQESLNATDNATESLIERPEEQNSIHLESHHHVSSKGNRQKGIRVMLVSCLIFAVAITIALIVDIYIGDHHTGHAAIATDVQECSDIGSDLMKKGGSAVDAAIGALFCSGLMNPESSGLGGGGFMVVSIPKHGEKVIDFRETAPQSARSDMFSKDPSLSKKGGLAVAIPGFLKGVEVAHKIYGKLKWSDVIEPTIKLARDGYTISKHTVMVLEKKWVQDIMKESKELMAMFAPNGKFLKAGAKLKNPKLADTLEQISKYGAKAFYEEGPIAQSVINAVNKRNGNFTLKDLKSYQVKVKNCLQSEYQGYQIMLPPLPSGGPFVISALNILERFNLTKADQDKNATYQYIIEAFKFAFAQRTHLGDPDSPGNRGLENYTNYMVSKKTAKSIQSMIFKDKTFPPSYYSPASQVTPNHGTTHVSVLSPDGEMVSVTSTINVYFGSLIMTDTGIILNNEMDDFNTQSPFYKANMVEPGKRPLSSSSPMIVKHKQDSCLYMAIGGSGGTHIQTSVVQVLVNLLTFGNTLKDAIERPRVHDQLDNITELEKDRFNKYSIHGVQEYLQEIGHVVKTEDLPIADVNVAQNYRSDLRARSDTRRPGSGVAIY